MKTEFLKEDIVYLKTTVSYKNKDNKKKKLSSGTCFEIKEIKDNKIYIIPENNNNESYGFPLFYFGKAQEKLKKIINTPNELHNVINIVSTLFVLFRLIEVGFIFYSFCYNQNFIEFIFLVVVFEFSIYKARENFGAKFWERLYNNYSTLLNKKIKSDMQNGSYLTPEEQSMFIDVIAHCSSNTGINLNDLF